jgi:predicted metal-binding membrane protein
VWAAFGILPYFVGLGLVALEMRSPEFARFVPIVTGVVVVLAGAVQFTEWKARSLIRCCETPACQPSWDSRNAWDYGLRLGLNCTLCCAGFMMILLVIGVMDLRIMALVSAAITVERLLPNPKFAVRAAGIVMLIAGAFLIFRAL